MQTRGGMEPGVLHCPAVPAPGVFFNRCLRTRIFPVYGAVGWLFILPGSIGPIQDVGLFGSRGIHVP